MTHFAAVVLLKCKAVSCTLVKYCRVEYMRCGDAVPGQISKAMLFDILYISVEMCSVFCC